MVFFPGTDFFITFCIPMNFHYNVVNLLPLFMHSSNSTLFICKHKHITLNDSGKRNILHSSCKSWGKSANCSESTECTNVCRAM